MKKFILTILGVAVFFLGLGGLADRAGAKFKSDDRALAIIAQTRQAIGGDAAINSVKSLTITGHAAQTFNLDGAARTEQGELEINLELPNHFSKMLKIGHDSGDSNAAVVKKVERVVIVNNSGEQTAVAPDANGEKRKVFVTANDEGDNVFFKQEPDENTDGKQIKKIIINHGENGDISHPRQNDFFRTVFALLLSAPEGTDANYTYAGESAVDGNNCDVVLAESGGTSFKLYIDKSSHLPAMMTYQGFAPMVFKFDREQMKNGDDAQPKTAVIINKDVQISDNGSVKVFTRKMDLPEANAEFQVKFSDFRSVGGVQLPYKWTQTVGGKPDQDVEITNYEVNPTNIADKFKNQNVMIRVKKPQ